MAEAGPSGRVILKHYVYMMHVLVARFFIRECSKRAQDRNRPANELSNIFTNRTHLFIAWLTYFLHNILNFRYPI